jgi:hypothetical protein
VAGRIDQSTHGSLCENCRYTLRAHRDADLAERPMEAGEKVDSEVWTDAGLHVGLEEVYKVTTTSRNPLIPTKYSGTA